MAEEKLVSVCINTYNCEKTIEKTLSSVIEQTYKNLQIIVVDDCSTDGTVDIIKGFNDERIELTVLPENLGVSGSNNECLVRAKGDYIAHLDSDDVWVPEKIEIQLDFMEKNPEYGACFSHAGMIDEEYNIYPDDPSNFVEVFRIENKTQAEFIRFFEMYHNHLLHSSVFIRKYVQSEIGLHDMTMRYLHDFDMWTRLVLEFPIYVIQKQLVYYMVRKSSHSTMTKESYVANLEENNRILYNMINNCTDKLFLEAYSDKLVLSGKHTHEETEIEKAIVLLDAFGPYRDNPVLGLKKFDELFSYSNYRNVAKEKFGMTMKHFHALHEIPVYYSSTYSYAPDTSKDAEIAMLKEQLNEANDRYNILYSSKEARLVRPLTRLRAIKHERDLMNPSVLKDGSAAKARFVLYGYYGHNVGDDLFFDYLFKRYPDTLFIVPATNDYKNFMSNYKNVSFHDANSEKYATYNSQGTAHKIHNAYEQTLIKNSDGIVHIGGSIFQQIMNWNYDLEVRKERQAAAKNFFSLSNNFGPYQTEDYKNFWRESYKKFSDICFRDKYSYELFSDIDTVRYAPDIIFSLGGNVSENKPFEQKKDSIFISVINPYLEIRNFSAEMSLAYENAVVDFVKLCARKRLNLHLTSFCEYEADGAFVDKIMNRLNRLEKLFIHPLKYTGNMEEISNAIADSKYVLATRFHAMILGLIYGSKVLPVCYSSKMTNVIKDMELFDEDGYTNIADVSKLSSEELLDKLMNAQCLSEERIKEIAVAAGGQFEMLDKFIESRGGTIVR